MRWIALFALAACTARPTVIHVVDGDTVRLSDGRTMRLAGIDCPESGHNTKCRRQGEGACAIEVIRGQAVKHEVSNMVAGSTAEVLGTEKYGRALGYVWLADGTDLGQWLVATGRCADWSTKYPHPRADLYKAAAVR